MTNRRKSNGLNGVRTLDDLQGLCENTYASWDDDELGAQWNSQICANIDRLFGYLKNRIGANGIYVAPESGSDIAHPLYNLTHVYLKASRVPAGAVLGFAPNVDQPLGIILFTTSRPFKLIGDEDHVALERIVGQMRGERLVSYPHGYVVLSTIAHPDTTKSKWALSIKQVSKIIHKQGYVDEKFQEYEQDSLRKDENSAKLD